MVGKTLGHYEILEPLGKGGMGEVYRARDTKLDRDVAIKVLPEDFATDQDRLARFEREAKLLASLNHSNIAAIYGLEDEGDQRFIAMELVEGETLAERIARSGRIEVDEALDIARQIAEALEAAHENGVIHRDLKPANVIVTSDGKVKVLDFGLAKAYEADGATSDKSPDLSHSPTMVEATRTGVIMGTAAYMSPEQAKGRAVDKRSDIWAFGSVFYELLTAQSAFGAEDVSETLAAILKDEPNWSALPETLSPVTTALLRRCLRKDVNRRLHDIADARIEIEEALGAEGELAVASTSSQDRRGLGWVSVAVVGLFALVTGVLLSQAIFGGTEPAESTEGVPLRVELAVPEGVELRTNTFYKNLAITPDGRYVVFQARAPNRPYRRDLVDGSTTPIPGADRGGGFIVSPDGANLAYFTGGTLTRIPIAGGTPQPLVPGVVNSFGATWGSQDTIVYNVGPGEGLFIVDANGGDPRRLTPADAHRYPSFLPDGRHVLFTDNEGGLGNYYLGLLDVETGEWETILERAKAPRYVASGHILFARGTGIYAVRFDPDTLEIGDTVVPVAANVVGRWRPTTFFDVSDTGILVFYSMDDDLNEMVSVDMNGNATPLGFEPSHYVYPRYSPDGTRIAVNIQGVDDSDVWVGHLADNRIQRLTDEGAHENPMWVGDSDRIGFWSAATSIETRAINQWRAADGSDDPELQFDSDLESEGGFYAYSFSKDGDLVLGTSHIIDASGEWGLAYRTFEEPEQISWIIEPRDGLEPDSVSLSPDNNWVLYVSNESGGREAYVMPFEASGGSTQISGTASGWAHYPQWSPDGTKIYYEQGNVMWVADIETTPEFRVLNRTALFDLQEYWARSGNYTLSNWDVAPDGESFLMIRSASEWVRPKHINVIVNFFEELKRLFPEAS